MKITPMPGPITVDRLPGMESKDKAAKGADFADSLKNSIEKVDANYKKSEQLVQDLAVGRTNRIHETMMAMEEADLSYKMMLAVRNKALDAYREIMRMSV